MPLDPQARALLDQLAAAKTPQRHTMSVADARALTIEQRARLAAPPEPVARVEDRRIPVESSAGELAIRVYTPTGSSPLPILVYFHGGGWVLGNLDTHDPVCRGLANAGGCIVVSVDYRLAPEHKFPEPAEDAYGATRWVAENAATFGGDGARLAVGGDSAGGNLAAAATLMARDRGGPRLAFQLLNYPVTNYDFETASYREKAEGYMLTRADMMWFWDHYLANDADARNPHASPLQAPDLSGLPPAMVITAEYDPLLDEGEAYAARLSEAGIPVEAVCYPGMIHGFMGNAGALDRGKQAIQDAGRALRAALAT